MSTRYVYFCGSCNETFVIEAEGEPVPTAACPACGYADAIKAFREPEAEATGACAPDSGC